MENDKIRELLVWFANRISEISAYNWDDSFKLKKLKEAQTIFNKNLKELIDFNSLTKDDVDYLCFGKWASKESIEEDIDFIKKRYGQEYITKEKCEEQCNNLRNTIGLRLIPIYLLPCIPKGITLMDINGKEFTFDVNNIDNDTRFGYLAYGIIPKDK